MIVSYYITLAVVVAVLAMLMPSMPVEQHIASLVVIGVLWIIAYVIIEGIKQ